MGRHCRFHWCPPQSATSYHLQVAVRWCCALQPVSDVLFLLLLWLLCAAEDWATLQFTPSTCWRTCLTPGHKYLSDLIFHNYDHWTIKYSLHIKQTRGQLKKGYWTLTCASSQVSWSNRGWAKPVERLSCYWGMEGRGWRGIQAHYQVNCTVKPTNV